jgi:hypothetical protein
VFKWILLLGGYLGLLVGFRQMGGFRAAGDTITAWGRGSAEQKRRKIQRKLGIG